MKDFDYYVYSPRKREEIAKSVYNANFFDPSNFKTLKEKQREEARLKKIIDKAYSKEIEKSFLLSEEFRNDLFLELDIVDNPKRELLYDKSCEIGFKTNGLKGIYNAAIILVDLIK